MDIMVASSIFQSCPQLETMLVMDLVPALIFFLTYRMVPVMDGRPVITLKEPWAEIAVTAIGAVFAYLVAL